MAPNFSKFYDDAVKEALGLVEFIDLHHPGEADLKEIKPKMEMPYKGYFPAGKICKIFEKDFFRWTDAIGKYKKHQRLVDLIVRRLNRTHGLSFTKADLIVSGSGSAPGSNTGGGYSWIHPRLMTHFLQWCCPEFAEEVLDVFQCYVSGALDIQQQTETLQRIHAAEMAAVQEDILQVKELAERQAGELQHRQEQLRLALSANDELSRASNARLAAAEQELQTLQRDNAAKYQELVDEKARREAEAEELLEKKEAELQETRERLDSDVTRPVNALQGLARPLEAERHSVPVFHLYAALVPRAMGIALSQKAFQMYVEGVFRRVPIFGNRDVEFKKLCAELLDPKRNTRAKARVRQWYKRVLNKGQKFEVCDDIRQMLRDSMCKVFGADKSLELEEQIAALEPRHLWNPVSVQMFTSKLIKFGEDVQYCTEVKVEKLVGLAQRFNDLCDDSGLPMHFVLPDDV